VNTNEHCGEFIVGGDKNGQWNDINCDSLRGYICKKRTSGKSDKHSHSYVIRLSLSITNTHTAT